MYISYILDSMKRECSLQYAVLVLCVLSKNGLMPEKLEELVNEKYQIFHDINVNQKVYSKEVEKILSEQLGKFVMINDNSSYVIIHTILAEEIALHYGRDFPAMLLSNMSYCFIQRWLEMHMDWTKHHQKLDNPISVIENNSCTAVWSRLTSSRDMGDLHSAFQSKLLCNKAILEKFMSLLEKKSFEEIKNTFLSPQTSFQKVVPGAFQGHLSWCHSNKSYQKIFLTASRDITEDMLLADRTREYEEWTQNIRIISWVIYHGHTEILEYILKVAKENGMDVREALVMGNPTPEAEKEASRLMVLACYGGSEEMVKLLLSNLKAEHIDQHSKRYCTSDVYHADTPLTAACRRGHFPVVKLLVEAGAGVNQVNAFNESPLCAALKSKNIVLIKFLLARKSSKSKSELMHSEEPPNIELLDLCMENGKSDVGNLMLMASKSGNLSSVKYLLNSLKCSDQQNHYKTSSLMIAIKRGHQEVVKALVEAGAGSDGISALNVAMSEENLDIAKDLIRQFKICKNMESDLTPLVHAAESGNFTILKELLITCPKEKCTYLAKNISLLEIVSKSSVEVALLLIKHGANVNEEDRDRRTPLYVASVQGILAVVFSLICAGAKHNVRINKYKYFPVYIASKNGHLEVVKLLITAGANLKMKTEEGFTSLMKAVLENKPEIARCLVGAENSKENLSGNYHLFEILKSFNGADFYLNEFDDIVPRKRFGFLVRKEGEVMEHIIDKDARHLRHLLDLGLDPNDELAIYEGSRDNAHKVSLLSLFVDKWLVATQRIKKIELLVERGAKYSVEDLRYAPICECDSSFLDVMNEVRCHIRRNSI
ncbi:ankyrin-2-like [Saccostrea cucullata]|uniref:ankyrin-2-like n=1 Tax=Saccostrea cuccullata TaxID=36930 RepID=UPI002ED503AF